MFQKWTLCICTLHAKSGLPTKSRHTWCLFLVLASVSDSSSLKTHELTIKLWGSPEFTLGIKIISWIILYMNQNPLLFKTSYIPVHISHPKCRLFKYWWSALSSKVCKKIQVRSWWRSYTCVYACVHFQYPVRSYVLLETDVCTFYFVRSSYRTSECLSIFLTVFTLFKYP